MRKKLASEWFGMLAILMLVSLLPLSAVAQGPERTTPALDDPLSPWQVEYFPTQSTMYALDMVDASDGWAGGIAGIMFHYNGSEWISVPTTFDAPIQGLSMVSSTSGWGVTFKGHMLRYNGVSWLVHSTPSGTPLDDVFMLSETDGWAVGGINPGTGHGAIVHWNGLSWQMVDSGVGYWLKAIDMLNANDGWLVGIGGTIGRWNGSVWSTASFGPTLLFLDVDMVSSTDVWVVGAGGIIYHYDGVTFGPVSSPTTNTLTGIDMVSADNGWAVGGNGTLLHYDGTEWKVVPTPIINDLNAIQMLGSDDGWIAGRNGALLHYVGVLDLSASTKAVSHRYATPGQQVTYTINVKNQGTRVASALTVTDTLPSGATYVGGSATTSQGTIASQDPLIVNVGDVAAGGEVTITLQATLDDLALPCWFVSNDAYIESDGLLIKRSAVTTLGSCHTLYLPFTPR